MGLGGLLAGIGAGVAGAISSAVSNANKKPSNNTNSSGSSSSGTSGGSSGSSSSGSSGSSSSLGSQMSGKYSNVDLGDTFWQLVNSGNTDADYLQSIAGARLDKAQSSGNLGQFANDQNQMAMQGYIDSLRKGQEQQDAAWQQYQNSMQQAADQQQAAIQAGIDSAVADLESQKYDVGKLTEANNAAAERAYMQTLNPNGSLAENLAANGLLPTGVTETSQIQAGNAYQGALNDNATTQTEALAEIERAINQARLNGDLTAAQALSDMLMQIAEKGYQHVQNIQAMDQANKNFGYQLGVTNADLSGIYNGSPTLDAQRLEMQKKQLEEDIANGKIDRQTAQKQLELLEQRIEAARLQNKFFRTQF